MLGDAFCCRGKGKKGKQDISMIGDSPLCTYVVSFKGKRRRKGKIKGTIL